MSAPPTHAPRDGDGWIVYDRPELGAAGGWHVSREEPQDVEPEEERQSDLFS